MSREFKERVGIPLLSSTQQPHLTSPPRPTTGSPVC